MSLHSARYEEGYPGYAGTGPYEAAARAEPAQASVAVAALLDDASQAVAGRMACRHLRFHVVNRAGAARIAGCRQSLADALTSLLENALAACLQGDYVELAASLDEDAVRIAVRDTGCGIPLARQAHLFDTSFEAGRRGKGLGLAIVRNVVQAHGGGVEASSAPGRGSEFALYLPLAESAGDN